MKFKFLFAWYDFWIGIFYDKKKRWIYILPLPTTGLIIKLPPKKEKKPDCDHCWEPIGRISEKRMHCTKCHRETVIPI